MYFALPAFTLRLEPATHQHSFALDQTPAPLNTLRLFTANRSARVSVMSVKLCFCSIFAVVVIMGRVVLVVMHRFQ